LGLLLVFRTNGAYARYDDARKIWGDVTNRTRDLCRQAITWCSDDEPKERMLRLIPAFAAGLMVHLRPPYMHDISYEMRELLTQDELRELQASGAAPPLWVAQQISYESEGARGIDNFHHQRIDQNLLEIIADLGKCERILGTPMPTTYTRHTTRFLMFWLLTLPLALYAKLGAGILLAAMPFISYFFLGIEDLGVQIEEPFSVLPLEAYVAKIKKNAEAFGVMDAQSRRARILRRPRKEPATVSQIPVREAVKTLFDETETKQDWGVTDALEAFKDVVGGITKASPVVKEEATTAY